MSSYKEDNNSAKRNILFAYLQYRIEWVPSSYKKR